MRIAIDARELVGKPTGVGRYLSELLGRWSSSPDAQRHEWRLYAHAPVTLPAGLAGSVSVVAGDGGTRWEQWSLSRALSRQCPDVLFAPGYTAPLAAPCPTALSVHDMSFAAHPEWFSFREGWRRRTMTAWSARRARVILTISMFSRDEIVRHIGVPAPKVRVIPLGAPPPIGKRSDGREPIILFVGSIFRRRRLDRLIAAFAQDVASRVAGSRLEIVGDDRTFPRLPLSDVLNQYDPAIRQRVTVRSYVDELTLHDLYARAMVFAFPSEYEGFGLTPLEALSAGVPPVVLDTPTAREVYGPAARYVDAGAPGHQALAEALIDLLTNKSARAAILNAAPDILRRYDWGRTAEATLQAIEEAAGV